MHKAKIILTTGLLALLFAPSAGAAPAEFQFSLAFSPSDTVFASANPGQRRMPPPLDLAVAE